MFKVLVILFVIKLNARNIFNCIKKKCAQGISFVELPENLQAKQIKILVDIKFIKTCKIEKLIPTFVNTNLLLKNSS